jgi:hypothetical protein
MRRVVIESPYAGDVEWNIVYLRACLHDSLMRGEAPFASHGLYTQSGVLDDKNAEERRRGMEAGWAWTQVCDAVIVYEDMGHSVGMTAGIQRALDLGKPVEYRRLGHPFS